jgi:hypothetical protein
MTLEANGGFRGTVVSLDAGGVYMVTSTGGRLRVQYGEHVKVRDQALVLRRP